MSIFVTIIAVLGIIALIFIGYAIFIINTLAKIIIPPYYCPKCDIDMRMLKSNVYTGQVIYECPRCGKRVSCYYNDSELIREERELKCSLNNKKSEPDKKV